MVTASNSILAAPEVSDSHHQPAITDERCFCLWSAVSIVVVNHATTTFWFIEGFGGLS